MLQHWYILFCYYWVVLLSTNKQLRSIFYRIFDPTQASGRPEHGRPWTIWHGRLCSPGMSQVAVSAYFQLQTLSITTSYLTNGQVDAGVKLIIVLRSEHVIVSPPPMSAALDPSVSHQKTAAATSVFLSYTRHFVSLVKAVRRAQTERFASSLVRDELQ